jgi:hypothetical protein
VSNAGSGSFRGKIDEQLEEIGRRRRVVLSVHQFILVPMFLRITDYVATLPDRFLNRFNDDLDDRAALQVSWLHRFGVLASAERSRSSPHLVARAACCGCRRRCRRMEPLSE